MRRKKSSTPYPQKMAVFAEKSQKLRFSTLRRKKTNLVLINTQKLTFCDF